MRIRRIVIPCILALAVLLSCRGEKNTPPETERVESAPESGTAETNEDAYRTIPTADTLGYTVSLLPPYDTDTDFAPRDPEDSATIVSLYHTATRENAFASAGFLFSIVREPESKPDLTGGVRYFAKDESHYYAILTPTDVRVDPSDPHFDAYTERVLAMNTFLEQFIADNGLTPYSLAEDTAANTARIPDTTEDGRATRTALLPFPRRRSPPRANMYSRFWTPTVRQAGNTSPIWSRTITGSPPSAARSRRKPPS